MLIRFLFFLLVARILAFVAIVATAIAVGCGFYFLVIGAADWYAQVSL